MCPPQGNEPMANEDGSLQIIYNGEIFNHANLRPELERAGHTYTTHCDTETILHAFEEFGRNCLQRFRGMFSFALWIETAEASFAPATGWESSLFTISGMGRCLCSPRK